MIISLRDLVFAYPDGPPVLHNVDLSVEQGESVLIVGPNGAGKSTLLKLLNGILKATEGSAIIDGLDTRRAPTSTLASRIAVTFQNPGDQIFASTVRGEAAFGPKTLHRDDPALLAENSLRLFSLDQFATRHPYDLAPAQRKLLTLASAVASGCKILAFDEPSTYLSQTERTILRRALAELKQNGRTLLIVSHDVELFVPEISRLVVLSSGRIVYDGIPEEILNPKIARSAGVRIPVALRLQKLLAS